MFGRTLCSSVFLTILFLTLETESARILAFFPTPSISHQIVFRPLTHELARRGHEVTVVTTDPFFPKGKTPPNLTEIDVHDISYGNWADVLTNHMGEKSSVMKQIELFFKRFATPLDLQLQTAEIQEILKKDRKYYDLLILEACIRPLMGIAHVFDAPIILFSSFGAVPKQYSVFGSPMHPLLFPTPGRQRLYNLSFWEKGFELFKHVMLEYLISTTEPFDYAIMQKHFGKDVPIIGTYKARMKMMFINEHPIWNDNRPVGPNIILFVGGIHQSTEKELPDDLKKYLDSSRHGVIYMSFGTNVLASALPRDKIATITKVFSQLPYDVILKWDLDELPGKPDNVRLTKWIPQPDLLRHPNTKLFITQGGLQSTDEAIDAAVPLVGIPMLGDQWYNVEKYVKHNIGIQLDIHTLTKEKFKQAIETVINDPSYKQNITKLRSLMRTGPVKPLDQAVFWVEHILEHGGDHLQPPCVGVSFTEYYEVNLVLVFLGILVAILLALAVVVRAIVNKIYQKFTISVKIKHH